MSAPSSPYTPCPECGSTERERVLGVQLVEMLAGAAERAKREAKPDDPVRMLRQMASRFGYDLVAASPSENEGAERV